MEIRKEIMDFAEVMEKVMRDNDEKKGDSYKGMAHVHLQGLLINSVQQTEKAQAPLKDWVDVANFCMMVHYNTVTRKKGEK